MEIWKTIPNYSNYKVSSLGNVKSLKFDKEKILKQSIDSSGYLTLNLSKKGKIKTHRTHVLVAMAFLYHRPNKQKKVIDHVNSIKTDNRLKNLRIVTHRYNSSKDLKGVTSKYLGVFWLKTRKKWVSRIFLNGKSKQLYYGDDEYKAHLAYQKELKKIQKQNKTL